MKKSTMKRKKLSGWDRKKIKEIEDRERESSKCRTMDSYFPSGSTDLHCTNSETSATQVMEVNLADFENVLSTNSKGANANSGVARQAVEEEQYTEDKGSMNPEHAEDTDSMNSENCHAKNNDTITLRPVIDVHIEYPTDPHLFCDKSMTSDLVRTILELGPCQPGLKDNFTKFPKNGSGRHFSANWYKKVDAKTGREIFRHWLVYSPRANAMFCFACWLFTNRSDGWSDPKTAGCKMFAKGTHKIEKHEKSESHKNAEKKLYLTKFRLLNDRTVVDNLVNAEKRELEKNRQILRRIIDAVLFLGKQGLAFRGHREYGGLGSPGTNEGNFLELIKLLAKNDALLEQHLSLSDRNATYLSPDIQNDLIKSISTQILEKIVAEIKVAKIFAVIVDSTIDISRTDQFSLSLRYVTLNGDAVERFIQFIELKGASAEDFFQLLLSAIQNLGLSITMCYGQAYDGASTMSGEISGLQARIKEVAPNAHFTHCCAHNLNLILIDAANSNIQTQLFFGTLECLYTFFTGSLPRLSVLKEEQQNNVKSFALTLKKLSDTRWASRKSAVEAVLQNLPALLAALHRIVDGQIKICNPKQLADAKGILATLNSYEFVILLIFWSKLLNKAFTLSTYLQKSSLDLVTACHLIQVFESDIKSIRNEFELQFELIEKQATELSQICGIIPEYKQQRTRKSKRFHDEIAETEVISDARKKFIVESYLVSLDSVICSTTKRFEHFKNVASKFSSLDPKHFDDENNVNRLELLADTYSDIIENKNEIAQEFLSFKDMYREIMNNTGRENSSIHELTISTVLKFIIANDMCSIYPNLSTLYRIFLTLPISSAAAERSFSRLKLIKSYLRSTIGEDRLSGLALISIEREIANETDYDNVIEHFARMKPRRKRLL